VIAANSRPWQMVVGTQDEVSSCVFVRSQCEGTAPRSNVPECPAATEADAPLVTRPRAFRDLFRLTQIISAARPSGRAKSTIALWFVLQIVLPFTAPLQICTLAELIGHTHQNESPATQDSATRQLASIADAEANSFVSPLSVYALRICPCLPTNLSADERPVSKRTGLPGSPQTQQTVLRL
jgi:hypothetical protein